MLRVGWTFKKGDFEIVASEKEGCGGLLHSKEYIAAFDPRELIKLYVVDQRVIIKIIMYAGKQFRARESFLVETGNFNPNDLAPLCQLLHSRNRSTYS